MASNFRKRSHTKAFGSKRALLVAAAAACTFSVNANAESVPPEHMRRDLSRHLNRRANSNGTLSIIVSNNCTEDIYPGINTQYGDPPSQNGFRLQPGESQTIIVSNNWQGRIWPRTNCTFPNPNAPNKACNTGDCAGALNCTVSGLPPVTLAEFTCDGGDNQAYYDISLVDGFSISTAIQLITDGVPALSSYLPNKTNPSCIASLSDFIPNFDPYSNSDNTSYLGTNQSTQYSFVQGLTNDKISQWCPWDCQLNPPQKPGAGVYPYPDGNIQRPVFQPCYSTCAKWNQPKDCCTGKYNSPSVCKAGLYSKNAKSVCPDAYTFAYDDKDSTFVVPTGGNYRVIFCPAGRSTAIIANSSAQAVAKLHGGLTSSANAESISPPWILTCIALVFTAGIFSML